MDKIYLTMDDIGMGDSLDPIYELKKKMPKMKLTIFVVPDWDFKGEINKNEDFKKLAQNDWIEVAVHGYSHTGLKYGKPVEGERSLFEQKVIFSEALKIMKPFLPEKYGFKAPGNHFNEYTQRVLTELGFSYFAINDMVIPLNGSFEMGKIITSHINVPESFKNWDLKEEFYLLNEGIRT